MVKKLLGSHYKVSKVQISAKQFFILSILFAVGDAIIYIPSLMAQEGLHTMWIAGLLGIVQAFVIAFIYTVIGKCILNNGYIYTLLIVCVSFYQFTKQHVFKRFYHLYLDFLYSYFWLGFSIVYFWNRNS